MMVRWLGSVSGGGRRVEKGYGLDICHGTPDTDEIEGGGSIEAARGVVPELDRALKER